MCLYVFAFIIPFHYSSANEVDSKGLLYRFLQDISFRMRFIVHQKRIISEANKYIRILSTKTNK